MSLGTEYHNRSQRCLMQAQAADELSIRVQWLSLATEWRALAEQADALDVSIPRNADDNPSLERKRFADRR
jgi:hypothetical protein